MQEDVGAPEDLRRIGLRVAPEDVNASTEPEPLDDRLDRRHEPARYEELRLRVGREESCEGLQPELDAIRLVLVAAEQENGPTLRPAGPPA